ncbi:MAG: hypothetical protein J6386_07760 [Candidatus Synoicihabitans palmerolidicus]|nr:hypothetical protein [Candidatus Synoicihabitans palmerolidicus]
MRVRSKIWRAGLTWAGWTSFAGGGILSAEAVSISQEVALRPPTQEWVITTLENGNELSWDALSQAAGDAALKAEKRQRLDAMEGWLLVAKWARILGSDQRAVTTRWVNAINAAQLGHENMTRSYRPPTSPLSAVVSPEFFGAVVGGLDLSRSFFETITPYDYLPRVLQVLDELYRAGEALFETYQELALAVAVVRDVLPPPAGPHGQVSDEILPRKVPSAKQTYAFWVESDMRGKTLHCLSRLKASELKFVIDAAAPLSDLRWAQEQASYDLGSLPGAYDAVRYRDDRVEREIYSWPGRDYALSTILSEGGICIDQGYFASEVCKAKGVPT